MGLITITINITITPQTKAEITSVFNIILLLSY